MVASHTCDGWQAAVGTDGRVSLVAVGGNGLLDAQWQVAEPESVNVPPAAGANCQSYPFG
jgi:hypothetical protein